MRDNHLITQETFIDSISHLDVLDSYHAFIEEFREEIFKAQSVFAIRIIIGDLILRD